MGETQSRPVVDNTSKTGGASRNPKPYVRDTHVTNDTLPFPTAPMKTQQQPWLMQMISNPIKVNVTQCAEASTAPPPPPLPPPPPSTQSTTTKSSTGAATDGTNTDNNTPPVDSIEAASRSVSAFSNPGPYEQAVHDGKRLVMIDTFDGFRCDINKQVSPFMAAIHSFHLGTSMLPDGRKSSYTFISQVADETGLLMARIDPIKGSLDGRIHRALLGGLAMGKLQLGVTAPDSANKDSASPANDTLMAEIDFGGNTWAGNLKYGSMGGGAVYGMNYMQTIHPNVAAGGEGMYIASNGNFVSSYSMKFNWTAKVGSPSEELAALVPPPPPQQPGMPPVEEPGQSMICMNYNTGQMVATVNYKRCVTPNRLVLGAELQFSPVTLDSQVLLGAEYKWQRSKLNLCVDGGGRIQSLLEAKYGMAPGSPSLSFSAEMDHYNDVMKFGYGINIES